MSQSNKVNKISVRNRPGAEGQLTAGANTQVLLNGEPVKGACFIKVEVHARKVAKVVIEMYAEVEIDANVGDLVTIKETDMPGGKSLVRRAVSNIVPTNKSTKE